MPTSPAIADLESAYEGDRRARLAADRERGARRSVLDAHREEVEDSVTLGREASRMEEQVRLFDDPTSGFEERVRHARRERRVFVAVVFTYLFIGVADFWLATPDVAETFANKATSLVSNFVSGEEDTGDTASSSTPVWLRVCMGIVLTSGFLFLTGWIKDRSNEAPDREAIAKLQPGDDMGYRSIQRRVWFKRGMKIAYLGALAGLLNFLYSYDLQRARLMQDVHELNQEEIGWEGIGLKLFGGAGEESEVDTAGTNADKNLEPESGSFADLAKPAVVIYTLLWMLHAVLLMVPHVKLEEEREIASFKRGRVERQAYRLRDREERNLRNLLYRIHEHDGDLREALIREAQPLAARINEAAGRAAMEVPDSQESTAEGQEAPGDTGLEEDNLATLNAAADSAVEVPENDHGQGADQDPYRAIFG